MEERVIVKSKSAKRKVLLRSLVLALIFLIVIMVSTERYYEEIDSHENTWQHQQAVGAGHEDDLFYETYKRMGYLECDVCENLESEMRKEVLLAEVSAILIVLIPWLLFRKYELTVTNERIYGKASFGRFVEIPIESVTGVTSSEFLKLVTVSAYGGKTRFWCISNSNAIYIAISDLLMERRNAVKEEQDTQSSALTEKIKEYQELLLNGVITEEEYEEKRKQILGL